MAVHREIVELDVQLVAVEDARDREILEGTGPE